MSAADATVAASVAGLLRSLARPPGAVVVDLSHDEDARAALASAGFDCVTADPEAPGTLADAVRAAAGGSRPVAAIWLGDALQRTGAPDALLDAARDEAVRAGGVPLVVAVSNVTHRDVAAKLLMGRWDVRASGILQASHRRQFTDRSLGAAMSAHGLHEVAAADVLAERSDQHDPAGAAPLEPSTSLGAQLAAVRAGAGPGGATTAFVRAYEPGPAAPGPNQASPAQPGQAGTEATGETEAAEGTEGTAPFLSVLVRTQGARWETLHETLLSLAAQHCDDLEVLVLLHDGPPGSRETLDAMIGEFHPSFSARVRVVEIAGGGRARPLNHGARVARGRYLAMVDDDDLVFAHWAALFEEAAARAPGRLVRVGVATQHVVATPGSPDGVGYEITGRPVLDFAIDADHVEHVLDNRTPVNGYAVPRSLVADLGVEWDDTLPVLEDWDHLLRAMAVCGLENVPEIAGLLRWWDEGEDSKRLHAAGVWDSARAAVIARRDEAPLVLGAGTFSRLRARIIDGDVAHVAADQLRDEVRRLAAELDATRSRLDLESGAHQATLRALDGARAQLGEVYSSTSWRATEGLRQAAELLRRAGEAARRRLDEHRER